MLRVAALNGFLGNRAGFDVADDINPKAKACGIPYYTVGRRKKPARGGAGPIAKNRFYRWIEYEQEDSSVCFLFVGKSFGAHWIVQALQKKIVRAPFSAILFDPACSLLPQENRIIQVPESPECITVIRQLGKRSGYQISGARDVVIDARHSTIERTRQGRRLLKQWISKNFI